MEGEVTNDKNFKDFKGWVKLAGFSTNSTDFNGSF